MNIGILTSSRADYGIYRPLLKALHADSQFKMELIVFGSHLSEICGHTFNEILADGFSVKYQLETFISDDSPLGISQSIGSVTSRFAAFWEKHSRQFDLIFCLGDRYEMFAAVQAGIPFNLCFAHIHGGETTLGAIDNVFRHCLTQMSQFHFTSHKNYVEKIVSLKASSDHIYNVGALGLDNLSSISLLTIDQIKTKYKIDLSNPTILFTFHPETVKNAPNKDNIDEIISVLQTHKKYQIVITGTNTDTHSKIIRNNLKGFAENNSDRVFWYESLGTKGYYSFMKWCSFLMGNTSSGIIEAASFGKYVIDLGERQKGRLIDKNTFRISIEAKKIDSAIQFIENAAPLDSSNIYWQGGAATKILDVLKKLNQ